MNEIAQLLSDIVTKIEEEEDDELTKSSSKLYLDAINITSLFKSW